MIAFILAAIVASAAIANGCQVTDHKPVGEACSCTDACLGNSFCQHDGKGGYACQCLPCQYYDNLFKQCVDIPDYNDPCNDKCTSNFVCASSSNGGKTCQCAAGYEYDKKTHSCVQITGPCVNNQNSKGCVGQPNGDYPACFPECQKGIFVTCSNGYLYVRDCALGWYVKPNGQSFTEKLVFDPDLKRCERKTKHCPRELDNQIQQ